MTELEELAVKAIEARKALDANETAETMIAARDTRDWFQHAVEPEAYLTLIQEKREMEEALKEMEPELRGMIYEQYKGTLHYPDQQRRYKRDLGICDRTKALLITP